jgi:hypothetical protein
MILAVNGRVRCVWLKYAGSDLGIIRINWAKKKMLASITGQILYQAVTWLTKPYC